MSFALTTRDRVLKDYQDIFTPEVLAALSALAPLSKQKRYGSG